jgi:hypothetical protein
VQRRRNTNRLVGHDYSQPGEYFVTLCTKDREDIFGEIIGGEMRLNEVGEIAVKSWKEIPLYSPCIELDEFVVMPNHVHGIIAIVRMMGLASAMFLGGAIQESPRLDRDDPDPQSAALGNERMKPDLCFRQWARPNAGVELTSATVDICQWMVILEVVELVRWSNILPGGRP